MFFFIGVIMMSIQGGYSRRIQPGHHIKAVRTVRPLKGREKETGPGSGPARVLSEGWCLYSKGFPFPSGNPGPDPSVHTGWAGVELGDALSRPGVVRIR